ncbi:hypothetical protein RND81_02G176300 [Saponaria officinalis]|uniref:SWIM-type domain-containing protein n=1 Tax=Saponaria officinalis TaxID=3572 RepID=A0AAW1MYR6_SAPOF
MFINNLEKLVQSKKGFQYAYHVDEGRNLCRVFWTDAHGKSAYLGFGDGVSFDPTYGTNKYCMVFTPFTGIDNQKKSVTFACALLSNEDEESFVWLLITDQDPAIRNAVPIVFKTARHRFYMWHIMNKVADEIDIITRKETDILSLESHALTLYTHELFYEIQEEINSSMYGVGIVGYIRSASVEMTTVPEDSQRNKIFGVQYNALTSDVLCTCKLFERRELICMHIFWVFSNKVLKTIPKKYILPQWSKNALRGPIYDLNGNIFENYDTADELQLEMSKVWSEFYNVISAVAKKEAAVLRGLQRVLKEFKDTVEQTTERMSKQQEMEMLIGCSALNEVRILPPRHSKNKGSGKRIVTSKNKAIEKAKKPKRSCGNSNRLA